MIAAGFDSFKCRSNSGKFRDLLVKDPTRAKSLAEAICGGNNVEGYQQQRKKSKIKAESTESVLKQLDSVANRRNKIQHPPTKKDLDESVAEAAEYINQDEETTKTLYWECKMVVVVILLYCVHVHKRLSDIERCTLPINKYVNTLPSTAR